MSRSAPSSPSPTGNPLDRFRQDHGLNYAGLADLLGIDARVARRYCLPLDHAEYRYPTPVIAARLPEITSNSVHVGMLIPAPGRAANRAARKQAGTDLTPRSNKVISRPEAPQ